MIINVVLQAISYTDSLLSTLIRLSGKTSFRVYVGKKGLGQLPPHPPYDRP